MIDYDPIWDEAAERAAIGAALLSADALTTVADSVSPDDFYRPAHAEIVTAALSLAEAGKAADSITVIEELRRRGSLVRVGGAPYVLTCIQSVPTAVNAGYYAEIVADMAVRRRLVDVATRITQLAQHPAEGSGVRDLVEHSLAAVAGVHRAEVGDLVETLDEAMDEAFAAWEAGAPKVVPLGLRDLDLMLGGGLRPGTLTVIAARPGVGKSMIATNVATAVAQHGTPTLVVCLEMGRQEVTERVAANIAGVSLDAITRCELSEDQWSRLRIARARLKGAPLIIRALPSLGVSGLRRIARDISRRPAGLGLIVVDYLQQMTPADSKSPREQQVAAISRGLKIAAMELGVPVIALSQTNRAAEAKARPSLGDLRESGALEADADAVLVLHRPDEATRNGELDVHILKNRRGRLAEITLSYSPHLARIRCMSRLEAM